MKYLKLFEQKFNGYDSLLDEVRKKYPNINKGGCAVFAKAFNSVTGFPIYLIFDNELTEEDPPIHVVVKLPDGKFIDGESIRTKDEIRRYYDDGETGELTFLDNSYNLLDVYYEDLGEGLFTIDFKDDYDDILNIIIKHLS